MAQATVTVFQHTRKVDADAAAIEHLSRVLYSQSAIGIRADSRPPEVVIGGRTMADGFSRAAPAPQKKGPEVRAAGPIGEVSFPTHQLGPVHASSGYEVTATDTSQSSSMPLGSHVHTNATWTPQRWTTEAEEIRSNRQRLLTVIAESPGLSIDELADSLGVFRTAAKYHVRRLVQEGQVITHRNGRFVLHFPPTLGTFQRFALSLLRVPSIRLILDKVYDTQRITNEQLIECVGLPPRTVLRALRRLEKQGLLIREKVRNASGYIVHIHPDLRIVMGRWVGPDGKRTAPLPETPWYRAWFFAIMPDVFRSLVAPW